MQETIKSETAAVPSAFDNLEYWAQSINKLSQNIDALTGIGDIPREYYPDDMQRVWDIKRQIVEGGGGTAEVTRYFELKCSVNELESKVYGREPRTRGEQLNSLLLDLGEDVLGVAMANEDSNGPLHGALIEGLSARQNEGEVISAELKLLTSIYKTSSAGELFGVLKDDFGIKVIKELATENGLKWMKHIDCQYDGDKSIAENAMADREWMAKTLQSYAGIELTDAQEYTYSAAIHYDNALFLKILNAFEHFGPQRIGRISKATGIHSLEAYSTEQLERMAMFAEQPESLAADLAEHDVVVVLANRVGDHNSVFRNIAGEVDDETGRVLFFEINNMPDIYRKMTKLKRAGINPSTVIVAAHSNKGQFMISDNRDPSIKKRDIATVAGERLVKMVNASNDPDLRLEDGQKGYSISGLNGFSRLVDDFMAPSLGLDDDKNDTGRKKLIFSACYAGAETNVAELDENGVKVSLGEESVISKLANELSAAGTESLVDIYGAADGMQLHRTKGGLRYSGQHQAGEFSLGRTPLHAVRMRLERGNVSKDEVDEIPLRQPV